MMFRLYVNQIMVFNSDSVESVGECIDTWFTLMSDMFYNQARDTDMNRVLEKLNNGEYQTAEDTKLEITDIYVTL